MSVVKNFSQVDQSGRLGEQVYYVVNGETRARKLAAKVNNPRTVSQMEQRTKWANLVNFYRANRDWMKYAFENKARNQSDYNKFMSLNVANSRIYLPKSFANQGACVVDAYTMTQGSLPSIETISTADGWDTNLYLSNAGALPENPTVKEVSEQLLAANPALREGDQLSFIRLTQQTNPVTGVPYVVVRKYEVLLSTSSVRFFFDYMPADYIAFNLSNSPNCIEVLDSGNAGGFLLILSRTISGKTYVSSQNIVVANNAAMIDAYSSSNAQQAAIDSYGESAEPFLTSSTANVDSQAATGTSVLAVKVDGTTHAVGSVVYPCGFEAGDAVEITMNQAPRSNIVSARMVLMKGGSTTTVNLTDVVGSGAKVTAAIPDNAPDISDYALMDVYLSDGGMDFRAPFLVPNEATVGGLE